MTEIKVCGIKKEDDLLRLIDFNVRVIEVIGKKCWRQNKEKS